MAFVNEKIDGKWQTIDRHRNAVLYKVSGPDQEGIYDCELLWDGYVIKFSSPSGMKIHGTPKLGEPRQYDMSWRIFRLIVPEAIQGKKAEVFNIITEALEIYGDNYNTQKASSVSVQFTSNLI